MLVPYSSDRQDQPGGLSWIREQQGVKIRNADAFLSKLKGLHQLTGNDASRMAESAAINKSLSVLGQVVHALNQNAVRDMLGLYLYLTDRA